MTRYRILYRDEDPACPVFAWSCEAASKEEAIEKFHEGLDAEGWVILDVKAK